MIFILRHMAWHRPTWKGPFPPLTHKQRPHDALHNVLYFYTDGNFFFQIVQFTLKITILKEDASYWCWNVFGMRLISSPAKSSSCVTCELLGAFKPPLPDLSSRGLPHPTSAFSVLESPLNASQGSQRRFKIPKYVTMFSVCGLWSDL